MASVAFVGSLEGLVASRLVGGVGLSAIIASIMAGVVKVGTPLNRTQNMATLTQARNAGLALGPAVGGLLGNALSMEAAFAGVGVSLFASAAAFSKIYRDVSPGIGGQIGSVLGLFRKAFRSWRHVLRAVPNIG